VLTFIKLGGSLITDKRVESSFRDAVALRVAQEIRAAIDADSSLQMLVGHGSGSFGHFAAKQHRTIEGVHTPEQWRAFAHVAVVASELNYLVARVFEHAGVPVWRIQPSASARAEAGRLGSMEIEPIRVAIQRGIVPLVYGDVALDFVRGGTIISTEAVFFYLAQHLPVRRVLLLGEVEGVYAPDGQVIPEITPSNLAEIENALGGSAGVDVTGGMETKVRDMLALTQNVPGLEIRIMSGLEPDLLRRTLRGQAAPGTLIYSPTAGFG
jgi:isopentenyl phosphate kinase